MIGALQKIKTDEKIGGELQVPVNQWLVLTDAFHQVFWRAQF